ncbi:AAA family ATPase [Actinokineospora terrae]|uniref:AAA family ATPase n=1 Tax=Actinokineospora terrae TaxID=155974 RepID=UPI0015A6A665|nr:AAA family ATPase [Actinokineospora terrae]
MRTKSPVTIGVLGTHSTGKSIFLARLGRALCRNNFQIVTVADLGERAKRIGLPTLFNHTYVSTLWFITRGISNELEASLHADVVLVDRAVPDALGYYRAALAYCEEQPDAIAVMTLESMMRSHSEQYDLLLRTTLDPDLPLGRNKSRDPDLDFRALANQHVLQVLLDLDHSHEKLHSDGHEAVLDRALAFANSRLTGAGCVS